MSEAPVPKRPRLGAKSFFTMGEAMIRYEPIDEKPPASATRHLPQAFLRSLGGDELNVAVALSLLGVRASWVSVIPTGPMGDVVAENCSSHGVELRGARMEGDLGMFTILPEEKAVHYQRRHSAFALHDPRTLRWDELLCGEAKEAPWLHVTGITPLVSAAARQSWDSAIRSAKAKGMPVSLDLNHRKQLGTLQQLWQMVQPHCPSLEVLVLSVDQLLGLAELHGIGKEAAAAHSSGSLSDEQCLALMKALQAQWKCRCVALCRKTRDPTGLQRRWSLMTELGAREGDVTALSTNSAPVWHRPREECGGGSAWMAGLLHGLYFAPVGTTEAMRRADLLSALCQETKGDFSKVTYAELKAAEDRFGLLREARLADAATAEQAGQQIEATLQRLKSAGVVAILRAKGDPETAIRRGLELAEMGCKAMEVTMDATDWPRIIKELRRQLPADVDLGVGTVMDDTMSQLGLAVECGASFALSPIDPLGFVEECRRRGVLAIPSAFTSNECWQLHRRGVRLIKLFHAGTISPAILKSMLDVTPLGQNLNIIPSGGVSPSNAKAWFDAGVAAVGMGSNLCGQDISTMPGTPAHKNAQEEWASKGKQVAADLFTMVADRRKQAGSSSG